MNIQLCWLRTDLRALDNPALSAALSTGPTLAIYIATPDQWINHDDAPVKLDFWRRNLIELRKELEKLRVELLFFQVSEYRNIPKLLSQIIHSLGVSQLHYNRELPLNERLRDELVDTMCKQQGVAVSAYDDQLLVTPQATLNKAALPFKVFTPFAKKVRTVIGDGSALLDGPVKPLANTGTLPTSQTFHSQCKLEDINWPQSSRQWEQLWPAGEEAAWIRLREFTQKQISSYKNERDIPSLDSTSHLSAYLAGGVVSVAGCWRSASNVYNDAGVETWQNELLWREFYRHTVFHFPHLCKHESFRENVGNVPWRHDAEDFRKWCHGQTGYPIVDAGMRQLLTTGWMHNRLRMITAMFLSKHLLIDWRWGERWFMQNLIDGDFASNNGGWQWCASTGVDAAPYFRIFSPTRQSRRFDPEGSYIRRYVPELSALPSKLIHEPGDSRPSNYPSPIIEHRFARERALNAFRCN